MRLNLRTYLAADAQIAASVGSRIMPLTLPKGTPYPAITYQQISAESIGHMSGLSGLKRGRFQVDVFAREYAEAVAIAKRVRAILDGYRGTAGDALVGGAWMDGERDGFEESVNAYRITTDYRLTYNEG